MQTKTGSFIESITNTFVGFLITLIASPLFYWIAGVKISGGQIGILTLLFTILSIARGYVVRRFFNKTIIKNVRQHKNNSPKST